jgi:hypothetical protein
LIQQYLPNLSMLNIAQNIYWKPDQQILSLPNLKIIYLLLDSFEGAVNTLRCYLIRNRVRLYAALIKAYSCFCILDKGVNQIITLMQTGMLELAIWDNLR